MFAADVVGIIATIFSTIFFTSPITIMYHLIKTKETKTVPSLLFLFVLLNCLVWFVYGIEEHKWVLYLNNAYGMFCNLIYLTIFLFYIKNTLKKIILLILKLIMNG